MLGKAIALAAEKFKDKKDSQGKPYILHCLRVMNNLHTEDEDVMIIAVLHDIIEDTDVTIDYLLKIGYSPAICYTLELLTHKTEESYDMYIKKISSSHIATKVKIADLIDNSNITRLKGLTKSDFERMEKYHKAYTYLSK